METKQKNQDVIQAQVEHFADKGVDVFSKDQQLLLKYSDQLTKIGNLNKIPDDFPDELKQLIERNKDAYVRFLRKQKKEDRLFLEENAKLYRERFQETVKQLKIKITDSENPRELGEFLGSGSNGDAYKVEIDGEVYVAKFSSSLTQNNFEIKPLVRSEGIPHTPELIAFSLADGVKIMRLLPGQEVTSFTPEEMPQYPDEHIIQLIETILELERNGIVIDPKASNFFYDTVSGFSVLDFHLSNGTKFTEPQQQVMSLAHALSARKFPDTDWDNEEVYEQQKIEKGKVFFPTLIRFLSILIEKYPELLVKWKQQLEEDRADPTIGVSELVDRENWETDNEEINQYLSQLEKMGY
jgi:hypothetical protein